MLIEHINLANFVNPDPKNAETYGYVSSMKNNYDTLAEKGKLM